MKTCQLVLCFVAFLAMGCNKSKLDQSEISEHHHSPKKPVAYLEELEDVNVVSVFSHSINGFVEGPANFTDAVDVKPIQPPSLLRNELLRIDFKDKSVVGHADFEKRVRCLLVEVDEENQYYGIYGLWKQKATLQMPLPSDEASISWEGVSCETALIRVFTELGLSTERARKIVDDHKDLWFGSGLRAFLLTNEPISESNLPTIYYFEKV